MDILSFLYQLLIMPLQIVFEIIYYFAFKLTGNIGISIVALSFAVSLLVLPLYERAEAIQKEEREIEAKLAKGVEHIKKTFCGDEQLMMLQTYYRKNNYNPLYFLRGSLSLLLQIPFFIAAYQFLSNLELLKGVSFGFIKDLAAPDACLSLFGLTINVLPIIMTLVNLISIFLFTKGFSLKTKLQLNGMALFFLVFLYNSPAGLVLYWTLNNVFNLVKTIVSKTENPNKSTNIAMFLCSGVVMAYSLLTSPNYKEILQFLGIAVLMNARFFLQIIKQRFTGKEDDSCVVPNTKTFIFSGLFLALLVGAVIPSAVIESAPQEFVIIDYLSNPLVYLVNSISISIGTFVIWGGIFYWITNAKYKSVYEYIIWLCCGFALLDYMVFGKELGLLTSTLQFEDEFNLSKIERIINAVALLITAYGMNFIWQKYKNIIIEFLAVGLVALIGMVGVNVVSIQSSVDNILDNPAGYINNSNKILSLSKQGKNVIVFMLDRAMGTYVPYIFNEKPELKKQFDGFKYYANTISFGGFTNFGTPSVFGGYEYTPVEMNKRSDEFLKDKHNEALKVMPVLFERSGFNVIVCNPSYANYQWIPDLSIYDEYSNIKKYLTVGKYGTRNEISNEGVEYEIIKMNNRNFYMYGIMKAVPLVLQKYLYDYGSYMDIKNISQNQIITSLYTAKNTSRKFLKQYNVLTHLCDMTHIANKGNTFIMMTNDTTHEPCLLQVPEYVPASKVDNADYEKYNQDRFTVAGRTLKMDNQHQVIHYHANMASLIQLGKWFDYMRDNGVYDNTRIILVADHGRPLQQLDELILDDGKDALSNVEFYFPLMMVKDFNSIGFKVSNEFMTNADVATIATINVVKNPVNPFTGKEINNLSKNNGLQYVLASNNWNVNKNNGKTYLPGRWYSVHSNIWNKNNWKIVKEKDVLPY